MKSSLLNLSILVLAQAFAVCQPVRASGDRRPQGAVLAVHGVGGVAEVRVVEDVEELGSKTKPHAVLPGNAFSHPGELGLTPLLG